MLRGRRRGCPFGVEIRVISVFPDVSIGCLRLLLQKPRDHPGRNSCTLASILYAITGRASKFGNVRKIQWAYVR